MSNSQVLHDLKQGIDRLARERDNFEIRIGRAKKTMMYNAAVKNGVIDEITANKIALQMKDMSRADSRLSDQSDGVPAIGLCMYCVHVCVCTCSLVCTCTCMYCTCTCMYVCVHVVLYVHVHVCVCTFGLVCTCSS